MFSSDLLRAQSARRRLLFSGAPAWVLRGSVPADLDFDFANSRYYQRSIGVGPDAGRFITVSRASTGYAADTSGNYTSFANNVARITNQGLLVEETRTNLTFFSQSIVTTGAHWSGGAVSLTGGQASPFGAVASTVTGDGTTATHRALSTDSSSFTSGTSYTFSIFAQFVNQQFVQIVAPSSAFGGSAFANFDIVGGTTGTVSGGTATITASGSWYRLTFTAPASATTTGTSLNLALINSAISLRNESNTLTTSVNAVQAQCEAGTFATSPILTPSNAAVTRAADVVTVTNPPVFGSAYTLFAKAIPQAPTSAAAGQTLVQIDDGSANNRLIITRNAGTGTAVFTAESGGVLGTQIIGATWPQNTLGRAASSLLSGTQTASFNGGAAATSSVTNPVGISTVRIGSNSSGIALSDCYLAELAIFPTTAQPAAQLQAFGSR